MQIKLNEEKTQRHKLEQMTVSKEREVSMLTVEQRQLKLQFQKLENEYMKEVEKVISLVFFTTI